jgi:hypothetical protein
MTSPCAFCTHSQSQIGQRAGVISTIHYQHGSVDFNTDVCTLSARETGCENFGILLALRWDHNTYFGLLGQVLHLVPTIGNVLI